jgi:tetratricopeptide (TPR) repeat protein
MSSNNRLIFVLFFFFNITFIFANAGQTKPDKFQEGLFTLMALDGESNKEFKQSAELYEEIFHRSNNVEYLEKAVTFHFINKNYQKVIELTQNNFNKFPQQQEFLMQENIIALLFTQQYEDALKKGKELLKKYNSAQNYSIVGDVYYRMGSYKHAVTYYESSYAKEQDIKTLLPLVDILYSYVNEKQKAISYLETYHLDNGCFREVCARLVRYYQEEKNVSGMINILQLMYDKYKPIYSAQRLAQLEALIVELLEKTDIQKAINFLEKNKSNDTKLLNLYGQTGEFKKALQLVRKQYRETKDKTLLGQIAILEFEMAKDKKKMMKHVLANFELALEAGANANYENYYGYLLIDYDLNVKKGLQLVKKALEQYPKNLAYMDSVAWGYFKSGKCHDAYRYMKKVVDEVGLDNEEIKLHWTEINECVGGK